MEVKVVELVKISIYITGNNFFRISCKGRILERRSLYEGLCKSGWGSNRINYDRFTSRTVSLFDHVE